MKDKLELVIRKILVRKFPEIIRVSEVGEYKLGNIEHHYKVDFETSFHLSRRKVNDIVDELRFLFQMLSPTRSPKGVGWPSIDCSFYLEGIKYDEGKIILYEFS